MKILSQAVAKQKNGEEFVLVTVVNSSGSMPTEIGSKMLVFQSKIEGTVGGGALENDIIKRARNILSERGGKELVSLKTSDLDMHCGGEVQVFLEPFFANPSLWIFGGGHIAKELVPLCTSLGFNVTVVDERGDFANKSRFPHASKTIHQAYNEATKMVPPGSYVVIVTHKHTHDEAILQDVMGIKPPLPYVGMIGSARKVKKAMENLVNSGINPGDNIYSPIGLDLGGGSPADLAISITSELLGVRNGKKNLPHCRKKT